MLLLAKYESDGLGNSLNRTITALNADNPAARLSESFVKLVYEIKVTDKRKTRAKSSYYKAARFCRMGQFQIPPYQCRRIPGILNRREAHFRNRL